ncbi:MAG: site-2 protease family protein [Oscillospiraceae bacterium]|nr:site-2 protease family protein [Oscillospiraceae bacterium]
MSVLYVAVGILLFGLMIAIHELGHFLVAKACKVRVDEFSIGMGPAIFKKQKGETLYSIRCIPMGGFCAMAGEDESSDDPAAFTNKKPWQRVLILAAGSFMNFVMGFVIVLLLYCGAAGFNAPVLAGFMEGCPYEGALQTGDRIYSIDGKRVYQYYNVSEFLAKGDGEYDIVVKRDGKKVELDDFELIPLEYEGQKNKMYGFYFGIDEATPLNILRHSWNSTMEFGRMVWMGLSQLVSGDVGMQDMSGPVGIVDLMAETGKQAENTRAGLFQIFYLGAFIAVNLALMNMLPIPALDGGRIFFLILTWLIETVTRKKLDPKYEGYIHGAGMLLLLGLMGFVMLNDIFKIVSG